MKAIRIHEHGGPEVLRYEDVPEPTPKPGEVVVRLEASGVNFIDTYYRTGAYKSELPRILGQEGAGVISEVGESVDDLRVGDRVAFQGVQGTYAEYVAVPESHVIPLPEGVSNKQGAAVMLQGITAHYLACSTFRVRQGHRCLVHAAAGGVGLLLTQIAKRRGGRVVGTVSTEEKAQLAREAGCDDVINYTEVDFVEETRKVTGGRGVHVVYDSVGKTTFEKSIDCLTQRGMMVLFGQSSGAVPPMDPQLLNRKGSLYLTRPTVAHYTATREELYMRVEDILSWVRDGKLKVRIGAEVPLADAAEAHQMLESRHTTGKVILVV